jgi:hypothetical protein
MAESIESLLSKFDSLHNELSDLSNKVADGEPVMQKILDKLSSMEARQVTSEERVVAVLSATDDAAARLQRLEQLPPLLHQQSPPRSSSVWVNPFNLNTAPVEAVHPSASALERPIGHRPQLDHWDVGGGILGSHPPRPVTGMFQTPNPHTSDLHTQLPSNVSQHSHKPMMQFPTFDGTNPRLWKDKYESYFDIFGVSEALKPRFAALNFSGPAEAWLQTYELRGRVTSWEMLHTAVCDRFYKNQYQLHMKQLDNLKQTASVADYHAKFDQLAHNIMLYNPNYDDTFLVVRFLSCLKDEIRALIALHRPKDVDTASALALLQEEELESRRRLSYSKVDIREGKSSSRIFSTGNKTKPSFKKDEVKKSEKTSPSDKWAALKEFRRSNNLCFTCGEKWGKGHQCPAQVPLNAIHELMEVLDI